MNKQKIIEILRKFNIPFWTEGKNVSENSVNIKCPYCTDPSNHLGIFEDTGVFNCWRCNEKGDLFKLIRELTNISYNEFEEIVGKIEVDFKTPAGEQIRDIIKDTPTEATKLYKKGEKVEFPKYANVITRNTKSKLLERFLSKRQINIDNCVKYKCLLCKIGEYSHRMIIPVYFIDKLVGYQAVDLTGQSRLKYKTSETPINDYLYNYSYVFYSDNAILVEGIFDVWRLDGYTIGSFGTHLTDMQKNLIVEMRLKELVFCWDSDAYWEARQLARWFVPFVEKIKVVKLPEGEDPDSLGRKDTLEIVEKTGWI